MMEWIAEASPRLKAKIAGVFYLLNIGTGAASAIFAGRKLVSYSDTANIAATACYLVVTLFFYDIFKPVNRSLSLLAALFSITGCSIAVLSVFHLDPIRINPLAFFGFYCLLIGYLIFKSTFLPRILGALMAICGLSWLTFLSPPLAKYLFPYNLAPGILVETSLTVWLLVIGLNVQRWKERAAHG
jgi:hypothetical protein